MHFHWDNFDGLLARIGGAFGPPLMNLVVLCVLLGSIILDMLRSLGTFLGEKGYAYLDTLLVQNKLSADMNGVEIFKKLLTNAEGFLKATFNLDLQKAFENLQEPTLSVVLGSLILLGAIVIIVVLTLDFLIRAIGWIVPLRIKINDKALVRHETLNEVFDFLMLKIHAGFDVTDIQDSNNNLVFSRYHLWLSIKAQLDERAKAVRYHQTRDALLARLKRNRVWFGYLRAYLALAFAALCILQTWLPAVLFILFALTMVVMAYSHFETGRDLIQNDVETFVSLTDDFQPDLLVIEQTMAAPKNWNQTLQKCPDLIALIGHAVGRKLQQSEKPDKPHDQDT